MHQMYKWYKARRDSTSRGATDAAVQRNFGAGNGHGEPGPQAQARLFSGAAAC